MQSFIVGLGCSKRVGNDTVLARYMADVHGELWNEIQVVKLARWALVSLLVEGKGEWFVVHQDGEMPGLQHVMEVPHGLVDHQELPVVRTVFLLRWAQLPGEEGERLPDVLHSLLEDSTHGGGWSVRDQSERSGWMWMSQESGSRQASFTLVESFDKCVGPSNWMLTLDYGARKDIMERGLNGGCVWKEMPIEI